MSKRPIAEQSRPGQGRAEWSQGTRHRIASHRIASHRIPSHPIASHRIESHRIASHRIESPRYPTTASAHDRRRAPPRERKVCAHASVRYDPPREHNTHPQQPWGPFEMIDYAVALGAEPVITTTMTSTPEYFADLVEYMYGNETTVLGRQVCVDFVLSRFEMLSPLTLTPTHAADPTR